MSTSLTMDRRDDDDTAAPLEQQPPAVPPLAPITAPPLGLPGGNLPFAPSLAQLVRQLPRPAGPTNLASQQQPQFQPPPTPQPIPVTAPATQQYRQAPPISNFGNLDQVFQQAARMYPNVDPRLMRALMQHESKGDINAIGPDIHNPDGTVDNAKGLFQFRDGTARQYGVDVGDYVSSTFGAFHYMSDLLKQNNGNVAAALQQWNGAVGDPTYKFTRAVMANYGNSSPLGMNAEPLVRPMVRDASQWGRNDPSWTLAGPPGMMPTQRDVPTVMQFAQALLPLAAFATRLPLGLAIAAYGAMSKAQTNGQLLDFKMQQAVWDENMKRHQDLERLEQQAVGDAMVEYADDPSGMQQALLQIGGSFQDTPLQNLALNRQFDQVERLMQRRDQLNQPLAKWSAAQEQQKLINDEVAARDRDFRAQNPNATRDEIQHAHFANTVAATQALKDKPETEAQQEQARTRREERARKQARDKDINDLTDAMDQEWLNDPANAGKGPTSAEFRVAHGQHVGEATREIEGKDKPTTESLEKPEEYQPVDAQGKPVGQPVLLRADKRGGMVDATTTQRYTSPPGTTLVPSARPKAGTAPQPRNYEWIDPEGKQQTGQLIYDASAPPGQRYIDAGTGQPIQIKPGTHVSQIGGQAAAGTLPALEVPDSWPGSPHDPPPGVRRDIWEMAKLAVQQGKQPGAGLGRDKETQRLVEQAYPAAQKALGIYDEAAQAIKYAGQQRAITAIETAFGGGVLARNLVSLNTVADHISLFRQYARALQTGNVRAVNDLQQKLATMTGSPEVIDFALAGRITGDEVVRLLTTTGGTIADREDVASRLAAFNSPAQFEGAANTLTNYVRGRYEPLRQAYARGDPQREAYFNNNMVTPEARQLFQGPQAPIPGQRTQPKTGSRPPDAYGPNRTPMWFKGGDRKDPNNWTATPP